jgi:hypothetical protein
LAWAKGVVERGLLRLAAHLLDQVSKKQSALRLWQYANFALSFAHQRRACRSSLIVTEVVTST